MSVLQELHAIEEQVVTRLRELEPMVAEYEELRRVAERLNLEYQPNGNTQGPRSATTTRRTATPASRSGRSGRSSGQASSRKATARRRRPVSSADRTEQVLAEIRANPGTSVPEIGSRLKVDYTGLYRIVRKLEQDGKVRKTGTKLDLA